MTFKTHAPKSLPDTLDPRTRLIHGGPERSGFDETCEPIYMTSGYVYGAAEEAEAAFANDGWRYVYSRFRNPTVSVFEQRIADYEGAKLVWATGSGMAAVHAAILSQVRAGDRIVAPYAMFGSCLWIIKDLCPRYGVEVDLVNGTELEEWKAALSKPAKVVFLESPTNPMLEVIDIQAVADLAHAAGARLVVDNVFATPVLQKPFDLGADVVVYSATKHIDGQGRCLGGVILANDDSFLDDVGPFLRHTGPALSPFNAWLLAKGLETLELRVKAQTQTALEVARFLEGHPKVARALYAGLESHPQYELARRQMKGGSNLLAFQIKGGKEDAFRVLNALKLIPISNNLGDSKSLITHPATTTHQKLTDAEKARVGITQATLRLSVGLEAAADLIRDLDQALNA
ncbi:MAG TPA: O-succinylhomoserine sulfhydrylase [Azospirillaceae bacterium]|nr:O-succinylhomoserine sulfhydrylase [Azospirillaceae bacterium]